MLFAEKTRGIRPPKAQQAVFPNRCPMSYGRHLRDDVESDNFCTVYTWVHYQMDGLCKLPNIFTPLRKFFLPRFREKCVNDFHSPLLFSGGSQPPLPSGVDAFISQRGD